MPQPAAAVWLGTTTLTPPRAPPAGSAAPPPGPPPSWATPSPGATRSRPPAPAGGHGRTRGPAQEDQRGEDATAGGAGNERAGGGAPGGGESAHPEPCLLGQPRVLQQLRRRRSPLSASAGFHPPWRALCRRSKPAPAAGRGRGRRTESLPGKAKEYGATPTPELCSMMGRLPTLCWGRVLRSARAGDLRMLLEFRGRGGEGSGASWVRAPCRTGCRGSRAPGSAARRRGTRTAPRSPRTRCGVRGGEGTAPRPPQPVITLPTRAERRRQGARGGAAQGSTSRRRDRRRRGSRRGQRGGAPCKSPEGTRRSLCGVIFY